MEMAISRTVLDAILGHCAQDPAREACGLLFGDGSRIFRSAPTANVAAHPKDSFEIDPAALFAAIRAEREGGPRVIGHYHSHPNGRPEPSARDAAAAEPGKLWLIAGGGEVRGWWAIPGASFAPVRLNLV
jgi:proteasome lid subunit RPN8/RPN11